MKKELYQEDNSSKYPAIEVLKSLGYIYLAPEECSRQRGNGYDVILKDILRSQLNKINSYTYSSVEHGFSAANIERAMEDLDEVLSTGLISTNEKIYDKLLLGNSYQESVDAGRLLSFNLRYVDWLDIDNNVFHVTTEYAVESQDKRHNIRADVVLFINGIPFAVIECKAPYISVEQAIEQSIRNQSEDYAPQLFKFVQMLMATNKNSVKYATVGTPKKFWSIWKEEDQAFLDTMLTAHISERVPTEQDKNIISLFSKDRVMELIKYFMVYDANVKKICRYQQYYAIKAIVQTIDGKDKDGNRQGGVIWHTQGSGKSLTMVMLAKYILLEMGQYNPKVVIVTDRKELDSQIAKTFSHTRLKPAKASSGRHLVELINDDKADIVTAIIDKFNTVERLEVKNYSQDVFVLVDESHRSHYGQLATKMRVVFPNACYIGFTGTPLMKQEKNTMSKFGKLIHKYTIKDGVDDGAIVPIIYEGRFVEQKVDEYNVDLWFEQNTRRLSEDGKYDLKSKWSSMRRLSSTDARIARIAMDINDHFLKNIKNSGFKALLATNYKKDAVRYLAWLESFNDLACEVLISAPDMREGFDDIDEATDDKVNSFWNKKIKQYGSADCYEDTVKNKFCDGEIDILIVCGKLLTGFDAPICQVLYIDKELKEHSLLQAIARTNRIYDGKDYGLVVDYRGLIAQIDIAMEMYSGAGLENYDIGDLKGAVVDVMSAVGSLRNASSNLETLFADIHNKQDIESIEVFLAEKKNREDFYNLLCVFGKELNIVLSSENAYQSIPASELDRYKSSFIFYSKLRRSVKIRCFDAIDYREYEAIMQNLLDKHLSVAGLKQITNPVDIFNKAELEKELEELGSLRAKADAITSRLTKSISEKYDENPAYYESFSSRIKKTLKEYKEKLLSDLEYLNRIRAIMTDYRDNKVNIQYPDKLKNNIHAQAFYGVIAAIIAEKIHFADSEDLLADMSIEITNIIDKHSKIDWTQNVTIHNKIGQDIDDLFYRYEQERNLKVDYYIVDKIIENVKIVALRRF